MGPWDLLRAQERYVEQAKQALQAAPAQGLGAGGLGLGSARLEDLRGAGSATQTRGNCKKQTSEESSVCS